MIPESWLKERLETTNIRELSKRELEYLGFSGEDLKRLLKEGPSEQWLEKWDQFIQQMSDGDELWLCESPPETWANFSGTAGYAIVRSGQVIGFIRTRQS